jgi:copper chaperone CopZ
MLRIYTVTVVSFALASAAFSTGYADTAPQTVVQPVKAVPLKLAPGEIAIYVGNMHCPNCAKKIAGKLYRVKGVVKVRTDVKQSLAIVTPQAKKIVDSKAAWAAVRSAGFKPTKLIGPQGTFVANAKTKDPQKVAETATAKPS